jgi:hypothetical protein
VHFDRGMADLWQFVEWGRRNRRLLRPHSTNHEVNGDEVNGDGEIKK